MVRHIAANGMSSDDQTGALLAEPAASSMHYLNSAASVNANLIKGSPVELLGLIVSNTGPACFIKFYNMSTAPYTVTDHPYIVIPLGAAGSPGSVFRKLRELWLEVQHGSELYCLHGCCRH